MYSSRGIDWQSLLTLAPHMGEDVIVVILFECVSVTTLVASPFTLIPQLRYQQKALNKIFF